MSGYNHPRPGPGQGKVPELMLAPERLPDDAPADRPRLVRQAKALDSQILQHQYTVLTPAVMDAYHAADVAVWSWTTNSEQSMVDSIALRRRRADGRRHDQLMIEVLDRERPKTTA